MKRVSFIVCVVLALTCGAAFARPNDLDTPPDGVVPATITLSAVLAKYERAAGKRPAGRLDSSVEEWTFTKAGLSGTEHLVRQGMDFYAHIQTGPLSDEYGQLLSHRWHRDANGVATAVQSHDATSFEMFLFMDAFNDASDPKNDVKVLGESADRASYVLQISSTGSKHPEWVYYDKSTGLVNRVIYSYDGDRHVLDYGDYRETGGLTQPWHIHASIGEPELDDDFKRTSVTYGGSVDAGTFAMPHSAYNFVSFTGGYLSLPAKIFWNLYPVRIAEHSYRFSYSPTLVVRLNVNGRGLDFAISSAAQETLIDSGAARELGLSSFGQVTHTRDGDVGYETILPAADLGGLHLRNLAVSATPFYYHLNGETKVVGVLGYDVLSSGVFYIDYDGKQLGVFPSERFDRDTPLAGALTIPVQIDSGMPFLKGTLDSHITENILFDNDFDQTFFFGGFTSRYPASIKDTYTGKEHASSDVPFADAKGYGRKVDVWFGQVGDVQFGPAHFRNFDAVATDEDVSFAGHEVDAVMGGDLLQYYEIFLDFPHNRIFLRPNKSFFKHFSAN